MALAHKKLVPVEIKHGKIDFAGLERFMRRFKIDKGYVISLNREETRKADGRTLAVVPAYKFLLTGEASTRA